MTAPAPAGSSNVSAIRDLLTPEAVRARCGEVFARGLEDGLPAFRIDLDRMKDATTRVVAEIRTHYPALDVPFHSRWRHFEFDGVDLWQQRVKQADLSGTDLTAAAGDLAIISVLLDAGAGADWTYLDQETGLRLGRSEGLALASLRLRRGSRERVWRVSASATRRFVRWHLPRTPRPVSAAACPASRVMPNCAEHRTSR